jgi:hypothetical protein
MCSANPLSVEELAKIFSHYVECLFILVIVSIFYSKYPIFPAKFDEEIVFSSMYAFLLCQKSDDCSCVG